MGDLVNLTFNSTDIPSMFTSDVSNSIEYILTKDMIIWLINERMYSINMPCVCILVFSIILGVFGNMLAIYVFGFRMNRNNSNIFTVWLSIYGLITSILLVYETYDKRFPMYSGNFPILCKIERFLILVTNSTAAFLLLCIAFDRYFVVCRPLKRMPRSATKRAIATALILPPVCVWPIAMFHGPEVRHTPYKDISGVDCADDETYGQSIAEEIYLFFVLIIIFTSIVILIVLYVLIFNAMRKWKKADLGESHHKKLCRLYSPSAGSSTSTLRTEKRDVDTLRTERATRSSLVTFSTVGPDSHDHETDSTVIEVTVVNGNDSETKRTRSSLKQITQVSNSDLSDVNNSTQNGSLENRNSQIKQNAGIPKSNSAKHQKLGQKRSTKRSTFMFSMVSALYVLSFMPTAIVEALNSMGAVYEARLSFSAKQLIVIANISYFLNGSLNPLVYILCNSSFRTELRRMFTGL